ncbi:MAG: hypothetical protein R2698_07860 [Microthrixaceae bacterium]
MEPAPDAAPLARRYVELGLRLGRLHTDIVDAYHGPLAWREAIEAAPASSAGALVDEARHLLADLDGDGDLDGQRRRWLRRQCVGLETVARKLRGDDIAYLDEVEACYGVRPERIEPDEVGECLHRLDTTLREVVPGSGNRPLHELTADLRARHTIAVERLRDAIDILAGDFRARTAAMFGLPDGEEVAFELVTDKPYSGFNFYRGDFRSLVTINTDLPVLSTAIAHLVAHEAYPGHHTEGCHKEQGLLRRQGRVEQTIALIGTPSCLLAEGLADLGLEVLVGEHPLRRWRRCSARSAS